MNVIVSNEQQEQLTNLDIDVIKSITGVYKASEIVEMFKNFFYSRMILDVTSIKNYNEISSYDELVKGLGADKIVFYLPEGSSLCTANFLSKLISIGIYNFTTNLDGVKYLLKKPNTLKDVEHIKKMAEEEERTSFLENNTESSSNSAINNNIGDNDRNNTNYVNNSVNTHVNIIDVSNEDASLKKFNAIIIGFKNVTEHAGASSLIYMLKKELNQFMGKSEVLAVEIDKSDFQLFRDENMISVKQNELNVRLVNSKAKIILLDMNGTKNDNICKDVIYLVEPSTLKLNKLIRREPDVFTTLHDKKIVLNKSMLTNKDVADFEIEANISVFYNIPPLDDRKRNDILSDFLARINLLNNINNIKKEDNNKIFGLFRR